MVAVGICALILGVAPACLRFGYESWWTWTVLGDVKRGKSTRYSAEGFSRIGPRAVQALRRALRSPQKTTRVDAIRSLAVIGRAPKVADRELAKPAIPDLVEALSDPVEDVRIWAAVALGQIGPNAATAVEPLIRTVQDEAHPVVIPIAIQALGEIGPVASRALPVLAPMVKDPKNRNHLMAIEAFWKIGPQGRAEASIVVPKLIDRLSTSQHTRERAWIAEILAEVGPAAREAIPALKIAVQDPEREVAAAAVRTLNSLRSKQINWESGILTGPRTP
jgi:HEAT repeat protein